MRLSLKALRYVLSAALLVSCGGGSTQPVDPATASIAGRWTLRTVSGATVPAMATSPGSTSRYDSETLDISEDGTYVDTWKISDVKYMEVDSGREAGRYTRSGTTVTLSLPQIDFAYKGTFDGARLVLRMWFPRTESIGKDEFVFTK
jgi:hypothetical protein